jgi:putative sigma-54 modulation protein
MIHDISLRITFRNITATDAIKKYATDKITHCIQKLVHQDVDAHLVLVVEKMRHTAELTFHADGADFAATESSEDLYATIDLLVNTITTQLRKHKEKITSHHK